MSEVDQPSDCDVSKTDLGIACALIYTENIYFEIPVLDYSALLGSLAERRAAYPLDSLLHHALVAAAVPWLEGNMLAHEGFQNRQEAFDKSIERFEAGLESSAGQDSFEETQAFLLMAFALSQTDTCTVGRKQAQWLRHAMANLHKMLLSRGDQNVERSTQTGSRLWKRLWWSGFIMEQMHFLRYSLEATTPLYPSRFALDPRSTEPLLLEDFDLTPVRALGCKIRDYWISMQKAFCFIQRTTLFEHVAMYACNRRRKIPRQKRRARPGQIHHDDDFWDIQAIAKRFELSKQDTGCYSLCASFDDAEELDLIATRVRLDMIFFRTMIALHRAADMPNNHGCNDASNIWRQVRDERITHMARRVLATSRKALDRAGNAEPSLGAGTDMLRAITVAAGALLSLETGPPDRQCLLSESQTLLEACITNNDNLWTEAATRSSASPWNSPELAFDATDEASPTSDSAQTPRDVATAQNYRSIDDAELLEQRILVNEFDEMWNTTDIKCALGHPAGAQGGVYALAAVQS
ncbi:hypothetical protein BGZ61DRAFT_484281 [Ilyonectria robusta]|uniref:uncharacterized protein n=1 Tax=Ilyonectria robusta TaxID=1079257 RepID=UPI001E8E8DA8|nr:uncharacterized protein BGZ61DRAFT_484281 [Ilyonectria robusta]KAH8665569.1 hypothetical protein BGZ61DRAFT_484281 [Ilyonectria robusta]